MLRVGGNFSGKFANMLIENEHLTETTSENLRDLSSALNGVAGEFGYLGGSRSVTNFIASMGDAAGSVAGLGTEIKHINMRNEELSDSTGTAIGETNTFTTKIKIFQKYFDN